MTWIICGAGRGVGKTTLARNICKILPGSVYAKCGHRPPKPGKCSNFFNTLEELQSFIKTSQDNAEHIIAESNSLAHLELADITIFIDGIAGVTDFREDAEKLKAIADVRVSRDSSYLEWKKVLNTKIPSSELCDAVCDCLSRQKNSLFGSYPNVRSKVWFEIAGSRFFGRGLAKLLGNIEKLGTLQNAAKAAGMSYRYAWKLIQVAEKRLGETLVIRRAGGNKGGNSALSEKGRALLKTFDLLNKEVADFADKRFSALYKKGTGND